MTNIEVELHVINAMMAMGDTCETTDVSHRMLLLAVHHLCGLMLGYPQANRETALDDQAPTDTQCTAVRAAYLLHIDHLKLWGSVHPLV
jgi:hypothetical protein